VVVDPCSDLSGIESQELSPLDVGDSAFVDEASDVSDVDPECGRHLDDREEPTDRRLGIVLRSTCHDVLFVDGCIALAA
jgi:hypothetical protein